MASVLSVGLHKLPYLVHHCIFYKTYHRVAVIQIWVQLGNIFTVTFYMDKLQFLLVLGGFDQPVVMEAFLSCRHKP